MSTPRPSRSSSPGKAKLVSKAKAKAAPKGKANTAPRANVAATRKPKVAATRKPKVAATRKPKVAATRKPNAKAKVAATREAAPKATAPAKTSPTANNAAALADGRDLRTQGKKTMGRLLDAAMTVLADRGYHAARVDDVVRVAKVSHGTFYLYFANKEDLFRALAVQCADEMGQVASSLGAVDAGPEGLDELRRWLTDFMAGYERFGVVIRAWMEDQVASRELSRLGTRTFAAITGSLVNRLADARGFDRHEAELHAAALLALIERFTYFTTSRSLDFDSASVIDTLATVIHRGFFAGAPAKR